MSKAVLVTYSVFYFRYGYGGYGAGTDASGYGQQQAAGYGAQQQVCDTMTFIPFIRIKLA